MPKAGAAAGARGCPSHWWRGVGQGLAARARMGKNTSGCEGTVGFSSVLSQRCFEWPRSWDTCSPVAFPTGTAMQACSPRRLCVCLPLLRSGRIFFTSEMLKQVKYCLFCCWCVLCGVFWLISGLLSP